jgi:hypothetical protein
MFKIGDKLIVKNTGVVTLFELDTEFNLYGGLDKDNMPVYFGIEDIEDTSEYNFRLNEIVVVDGVFAKLIKINDDKFEVMILASKEIKTVYYVDKVTFAKVITGKKKGISGQVTRTRGDCLIIKNEGPVRAVDCIPISSEDIPQKKYGYVTQYVGILTPFKSYEVVEKDGNIFLLDPISKYSTKVKDYFPKPTKTLKISELYDNSHSKTQS